MTRNKFSTGALLLAMLAGTSFSAIAQRYRDEWKDRRERYYPDESTPSFKYPASTLKAHYRIDILVSMYLDELVNKKSVTFKDKVPDKAATGLSFYEGVSIAADSLKRAGYNIDIYVHDITSADESIDALIKKKVIDSADLVIGAVQPADIPMLAAYTKERKINFVSAMSPSDGGVTRNKYFTMLQPTLRTHCKAINADIARKYPDTRITLLYRNNNPADENAYNLIADQDDIHYRQHNCKELPHKAQLARLIDTTRPNVVVIPVLDAAWADALLTELSKDFPATHIEVYGMPTWTGIGDLKKEKALRNLTVNITTAFSMNINSPAAQYVSRSYKALYGNKVPEPAFRGYEVTMWYAALLKKYGSLFNRNYSDNAAAPFTKYDVKPQWDGDGHALYNENKHLLLSRYEGGNSRIE